MDGCTSAVVVIFVTATDASVVSAATVSVAMMSAMISTMMTFPNTTMKIFMGGYK